MDDHLIPAITRVGELYQKGYISFPAYSKCGSNGNGYGLYNSAAPGKQKHQGESKGKIVLATVKGDIHDIGKNMVALMLRNYGFDVIDLGKDVDSEVIIKTAVEENADIIGLSALMTTTMEEMQKVAES